MRAQCVTVVLSVCVCPGRCEAKGALTGSNAGITSIEFDSTVSRTLSTADASVPFPDISESVTHSCPSEHSVMITCFDSPYKQNTAHSSSEECEWHWFRV